MAQRYMFPVFGLSFESQLQLLSPAKYVFSLRLDYSPLVNIQMDLDAACPDGGLPNGRRVRSEELAAAPESTPESRRSTRLFCLNGAKGRMMHTRACARSSCVRKGAAPLRRLAVGTRAAASVASVHAGRVGTASGNGIGAHT